MKKTKKGMVKRWLASLLMVCVMAGCFAAWPGATAKAVTPVSVVSRDDGIWLFPLDKKFYNQFTDWAGCPGHGECPFGDGCDNKDPDDIWAHDWNPKGHTGVDISGDEIWDAPVMAAADGVAYCRGYWSGERGYYVVIEHKINDSKSYYSVYQHLNSFNINDGQSVKAGDVVGYAGNSGNVGAHLHFMILLGNAGAGADGVKYEMWKYELGGDETWWVRESGYGKNGRLVTNPSVYSPAGVAGGFYNSIPTHGGSVRYTFDKSQVDIGEHTYPPYAADIKEGDYVLINDQKLLLTSREDGNGGNVEAMGNIKSASQRFTVKKASGSAYTFQSKRNGLMLNVYTASNSKAYDNVTVWEATGHATQSWILEEKGGRYIIHPSDNLSLALTKTDNVTKHSARNVRLEPCTGADNQLWSLIKIPDLKSISKAIGESWKQIYGL